MSSLPGVSCRFSGDEPRKFFDPRQKITAVKVNPGTHYVTTMDEMIITSLGSCISACVRDVDRKIGGMNHFMLPGDVGSGGSWGGASAAMRYGNNAMETLINDLLSMGASRNRLEFKLFGGGNVIAVQSDVGHRNVEFVERWLRNEHFAVDAKHLGGELPRRLQYFPTTGKVRMQLLDVQDRQTIAAEEIRLQHTIEQRTDGDVELF